ncbi:anthranilate synthase component II [Methanospirillum stamsii]|uniref:anthranilate synthase n=1 Tax=Methanospirillum stamsii TaxID=1277351 RepID=A0A2V2N7B1_9EURY|nr:aminodeoxychorismate/anthranilate synthase component II [Methanospirillum stamsii]PWR72388.1 aminodeoxychorismate/anthranilate synthase component II [Methanospirillum stamsii]
MNVVIVDCFDSFTYNLYQLVGTLGANPIPLTSDKTIQEIKNADPDRIILSPGPGTPKDAGVCAEVIRTYSGKVPILGVCLGHQTIIDTYGGTISRMQNPVHGMTSEIENNGEGIFSGVPTKFHAARYHSLAVVPDTLPADFCITAATIDDGTIMAVSHVKYPIYGLQFHPESIMTPAGQMIMKNFLHHGGEC